MDLALSRMTDEQRLLETKTCTTGQLKVRLLKHFKAAVTTEKYQILSIDALQRDAIIRTIVVCSRFVWHIRQRSIVQKQIHAVILNIVIETIFVSTEIICMKFISFGFHQNEIAP